MNRQHTSHQGHKMNIIAKGNKKPKHNEGEPLLETHRIQTEILPKPLNLGYIKEINHVIKAHEKGKKVFEKRKHFNIIKEISSLALDK